MQAAWSGQPASSPRNSAKGRRRRDGSKVFMAGLDESERTSNHAGESY